MLILHHLPSGRNPGAGVTIKELLEYLRANNIDCVQRTVERDLQAISDTSSMFYTLGVVLEQHRSDGLGGRATAWRHAANSKQVFLRSMSNEQALMMSLVEQELRYLMPRSAYELIKGHVSLAGQVLKQPSNVRQARFRERVRMVAEGPEVGGPQLHAEHLADINEALLYEEQLTLRYCPSTEHQEKDYRIHPVGLVKQGWFYWLLAVKHDDSGRADLLTPLRTFRVDRIRQVVRLKHDVVVRCLPTLDEALANGKLMFFSGAMVDLTLRFINTDAGAALCDNFRDTPLSLEQTIGPGAHGGLELRASVRVTRQLEWMLQRVAHLVQVIEPLSLRGKINDFVREAVSLQLD